MAFAASSIRLTASGVEMSGLGSPLRTATTTATVASGVSLLATTNIPTGPEIGLDRSVVLFTLGISILTGILFGLVPAVRASKNELAHALNDAGRSGASGLRNRFRNSLVVVELALSLVVLVGAGLLIRSFVRCST